MKIKFFVIVMLLCSAVPVFAQNTIKSGTLILVYYSDDMVYVAADSRQTSPSDSNNKACKITKLGDHAFFTMTGHVLPDAVNQAKKTFDAMPTQDIRQVAEQWAKIMTQSYKRFAEKDPVAFAYQNAPVWKVITGIFGSSAGDQLRVYDVNISFCLNPNPEDEDNFLPSFTTYIWGPKPKHPFTAYGSNDKLLVTEFMDTTTQRAKEEMDDLVQNTPAGTSREDRTVILLNAAAQYVLDSPKHSDEVGGPIDFLELPKSGPSFWRKIKPECESGDRVRKP